MKLLITRFPFESALGGAERQTLWLMEGLIARGHQVEFLGSCETLLSLCKEKYIPHTRLDIGPPPVSKLSILRFFLKKSFMQEKLLTAMQHKTYDAVLMMSLSEKLLLTSELVSKNTRVFWVEHDRIGLWLKKNPWLPMLKELSRLVTTVVVSDLSKRLYQGLKWPGKLLVIPNGIDVSRLQKAGSKAMPPRIGSIARLSPEKGIDILLEAITEVPEMDLVIVGKGKEEGYLRKIIDERRLSDRVTIKNTINDVGELYSSLSIFVLPSIDHDPFGLVAAEAMYMGIPVIVTDQCGIADVLTHKKDALIVDAGSVTSLTDAIQWLIKNPEKAQELAKNGIDTSREKFGLEKMIDRYEQALFGNK